MKKLFFLFVFIFPVITNSQWLSSEKWVDDPTTFSFGNPNNRNSKFLKNAFNGIRLVFEPQFGKIIQVGDNRFDDKVFQEFAKFGVETNLIGGWVALQCNFIFGGSVTLEEKSTLVINGNLNNASRNVNVDFGSSIGLAFINDLIVVSYGGLFYDKRDFINIGNYPKSIFQKNFVSINIQPVAAIKELIKLTKS